MRFSGMKEKFVLEATVNQRRTHNRKVRVYVISTEEGVGRPRMAISIKSFLDCGLPHLTRI
jgi:hypothetical protein